ncbi:YtxH domain-containing protein [Micrococcus sp.]|uniref:YtxH domain-containing protein n=1 Tax=Micrococcus sp. TaxID=1271 RepID=UPI0026DC73E8|nr:YtxH domain-containing protein [Micrococcus sp.]MDO4239737.1 YtxH domain-containing protein [Micrococcus sp.]
MRWFTLAVGAAAGYLLGSAEGRQNLQKMTQNAQTLWSDPKTQEKVGQAKEKAQAVASDAKDKTQEKAAEVKAKAEEKKESDVNEDKKDQVTVSNNENVPAANATGADPDIISDPSTALGDEGPANA